MATAAPQGTEPVEVDLLPPSRLPWVSLTIIATVSGVALMTRAFWHPTDPAVLNRWATSGESWPTHPWKLFSSMVLTDGPRMTLGLLLVMVFVALTAERKLDLRTAIIVAVGGSIFATFASDLGLALLSAIGNASAAHALDALDFGPSAMTAGLAGAGAARMSLPWALGLAVVMLNGVVIHHGLADVEHVMAFGFGAGVARMETAR